MSWEQTIIYEHPLNELVRVCLRLEHLFKKLDHYQSQTSSWANSESLQSMLEIVSIADRPEFKSSLSKELMRHHAYIASLAEKPGVDRTRLDDILTQLQDTIDSLNQSHGKFAAKLKNNEFLNSIRLQLTNIGGACNINTPILNFWLHQSQTEQKQLLTTWLQELVSLREVIMLVLQLIRSSAKVETKTAINGFYEASLDAKQSLQLLRIELPANQPVYPEISAGRHRFCLRFLTPDFFDRASKFENDVLFKLTVCIL